MRIHLALGVAGLLFSTAAFPQAGGHEGHGRAESKPKPSPTTPAQKPADKSPTTSVKPVPSSPAFEGYRPYTADEPLIGWKEANDLVLQIGGHVGILKGAGKDETPGAHTGHSKSKPAETGKK